MSSTKTPPPLPYDNNTNNNNAQIPERRKSRRISNSSNSSNNSRKNTNHTYVNIEQLRQKNHQYVPESPSESKKNNSRVKHASHPRNDHVIYGQVDLNKTFGNKTNKKTTRVSHDVNYVIVDHGNSTKEKIREIQKEIKVLDREEQALIKQLTDTKKFESLYENGIKSVAIRFANKFYKEKLGRFGFGSESKSKAKDELSNIFVALFTDPNNTPNIPDIMNKKNIESADILKIVNTIIISTGIKKLSDDRKEELSDLVLELYGFKGFKKIAEIESKIATVRSRKGTLETNIKNLSDPDKRDLYNSNA